jgi:hypothetical protein
MSVFEHGAAEGNKKPPVGFAPDSKRQADGAVLDTLYTGHHSQRRASLDF